MKIFKKMKKGFTLVELVVVIAVIAILAAVSVGAYFGVTESANRSKLEQEGKQVHTAIQTISLAGNEHSSLDNTGLTIKAPGAFESALEESLGKEVALTDVRDTKDTTNPTICFYVETAVSNEINSNTKYTFFEYHIPGINNKKAAVNLVTGEVNVVDTTVTEEDIKPQPIEITLAEANAIGGALEHNVYTTPQEYILSGTITDISNTQFGNMIITSGEDSFSIYGLYQGENRYDAIAERPTMGDTVKVQGAIGNFNGTAQIKSAQLLSFEKGEYVAPDPEPISIEDAIALGLEHYNDSYTSVDYIVTGTIHSVKSTEYGNIYVTDGTNLLYVYGIVGFADLENKPDEGDTITLQGKIGKYSNSAQMKDATLISFVPGEVAPEEPKENTATITFDNSDKATFTKEQQVWTENDITVTNDKGASTTPIDVEKKYSNPARFYKSSVVTIEYTKNIVSMEITADSADYATVLVNSIGAEATSTLDKVNVILDTAAKTYTFTMSAQARVVSIDVTYDPTDVPTEPDTPVVPDEPEQPTTYTLTINPNPADANVVLVAGENTVNEKSITVEENTTVTYTVSKEGYETLTDTITVTETKTIDVNLVEIPQEEPEQPTQKTEKTDSFDFSKQGYANEKEITSVNIGSDIKVEFNKGTNSNTCKYYTSGTSVRVYGGGYFTISTTSVEIVKITLTFGSSDKTNAITVDKGTFSSPTWTGNSNSVKFTIGGTSGHRRIQAIEVTYLA